LGFLGTVDQTVGEGGKIGKKFKFIILSRI